MSPIDDELRRALERHAGDVSPLSDPVSGAERAAGRLQRRRQGVAALATTVAVLAIALVVPMMRAGDGEPADVFTPTPVPTSSAATPAPSPTAAGTDTPSVTPTPSSTTAGPAVTVYYLKDSGERLELVREFRKVPAGSDRVAEALLLMFDGALDPDYTTPWHRNTKVRSVKVRGELATVDLDSQATEGAGGSAAACLSLQQLVWTVTGTDNSIKRVALTVDGKTDTVSQWWGVGCGDDAPMTRHTPAYEVIAPVQISSHNEGDIVRGAGRFSFGGEATVFEATVSWSVNDAYGKSVLEGFATASKGAPARGTWQANVVLPGTRIGDVVELRAWETSAKDGSVTNLDTKRITIAR